MKRLSISLLVLGLFTIFIFPYHSYAQLNQYRYFHRGKRYLELGEYDKAIQDFTQAIELEKRYVFAYAERGLAWEMKGSHEKALEDYNKALEINPEYSIAFKYRGFTWQEMGEYAKAINDYNKAIELDPNDPELLYQIGCVYCKQRDKKDALRFLEMALKNGYNDFESIESSPIWENLKDSSHFQELLQKYKKSASL
jgi:tetratricopeptide (TPR) repeat protein